MIKELEFFNAMGFDFDWYIGEPHIHIFGIWALTFACLSEIVYCLYKDLCKQK